jgi:hypothetical protein
VNSEENFVLEFNDALTEMFIDRMDQNQKLFAKLIDNEEVQEAITRHLRQEVYEQSQSLIAEGLLFSTNLGEQFSGSINEFLLVAMYS